VTERTNTTVLLTSELLQVGTRLDDVVRDPDEEEDKPDSQPDILVEGQTCP
jgi:hypothetical protein